MQSATYFRCSRKITFLIALTCTNIKKCFVCTVYFDIEDDAVIILLRSSKLNILASAGVMTVKCLNTVWGNKNDIGLYKMMMSCCKN